MKLEDMIAEPPVAVEPAKEPYNEMTDLEKAAQNIQVDFKILKENETLSKRSGWNALQLAIGIGKELEFVKTKVPYGTYGQWVKKNCPFDIRTAQRYVLLATHVSLLKDCQSIREAYIRLGILKMPVSEVPLGEVEALKLNDKTKPADMDPAAAPAMGPEPRKYRDDDGKEISHDEHIKTYVVPNLFRAPVNRLRNFNFSFEEWAIENDRLVHRDFAIIEGLCNDVTARQLKDDMEPKEEIRLRVKALVKAIIVKMIEDNKPAVAELEQAI